jgi:hypothetical protein
MAKRLSIFNIPGDPDELLEFKHSVMDPVMSVKGPEYGGLVHVAAKSPDGSGIIVVNVWESPEASDRAFEDPEIQEARGKLAEKISGGAPTATHYEIVDYQQT